MKMGFRTLAALTPLALATAAFGQVFSTSPAAAIADNAMTTVPIVVAGGPGSITDLNVIMRLTHTFQGDLDIILVHPDGRYMHLTTDNGGTNENFVNVRFDGAATASVTTFPVGANGNFRPEGGTAVGQWTGAGANALPAGAAVGSLAAFNGSAADGTWEVRVFDDATGDTGSISYVSLEFNGTADGTGPAVAATPSPIAFTSGVTNPVAPFIAGDVLTIAVNVTPGEGPNSSGLTVNADFATLGGGVVAMSDNGVAPDAVAGDFIYTTNFTLPAIAAATYNVPITVADAEARSSGPTNLAIALSAGGQGLPTATVDLGSPANPTLSTGTLTGFTSGGGAKWIKITVPAVGAATSSWLDIDTNGAGAGNTFTNSTIALYDNTGARVGAQDTDDGASLFSMLSYGIAVPGRAAVPFAAPATANGLAHAGADGATLAAGTYWLGVAGTGVTFQAANWRFTGTSTQVGDCAYRIDLNNDTAPTNPSGTGAIGGATSCPGVARLMTVNVVAGTNPVSTGVAVTANLSAAGGSASQAFFNDGSNGDVTAGDNIWSFNFTPGTSGAFAAMPFTITDAEARSGGGTFGTLTVNSCSSGEPATFIDLGALNATPVTNPQSYAAGQIRWYKFSVGAVSDPSAYLDIWTSAGAAPGTNTDTEIGLFDSAGTLINTDDDDSDVNYSAQSFGRVTPNRAAIGTGLAFNGRDGALAAGTYWLAVCEFSSTFANNWSVNVTAVDAGDITTNIVYFVDTQPTNPTGVGSGGVVAGCGGNALATVAVTGGLNPASTGISVSLDTTALGGGSVAMVDDGSNGDVLGGDNIFSATVAVGGGADAVIALPFTVSDAQARSSNGSLNVTRSGTEIGDLPATAQKYYGLSGSVISGNIANGTDVDMYAICISDTAAFTASTVGGATYDNQLFLFNPDGTGVAMNDDFEDDAAPTIIRQAMINIATSANPTAVLTSGGLYYLAHSGFNRDPITSATVTDTIWGAQSNTLQFDDTWGPNGITPLAPVVGWTGTGVTGVFTITMTGATTVCPADLSGGTAGVPDCAVDINDLLYFLGAFEAGSADIDNGSGTGALDCATDINDLLFFLVRFEAGC